MFTERCVAATLRVHSLAKELGVPSKAVIEKCRAEGIELKNHMAAISIGLAESIREWFGTGDDVTSVEVADHVDVELARKARRKMRKNEAEEHEAGPAERPEAGVAVAEPPSAPVGDEVVQSAIAAPPTPEIGAPPPLEELVPPVEPTVMPEMPAPAETEKLVARAPDAGETPLSETVVVEPPPASDAVAAEPEVADQAESVPTPKPAPPEPPAPVGPAGPQVVPAPAELKGPTVVRIEAPEPHRPPRPRARPAARAPVERAAPAAAPTAPKGRGRVKGRRPADEDAGRQSRSPRRHGGSTDVDQRLREWRDQDLLERKERLAAVTGHGLRDRRAAERRRQATATGVAPTARKDVVSITTPIPLKDFCAAIGVPFIRLSKALMEHTGQMWTINQSIDAEQAELLGLEAGVPIQIAKAKTVLERLEDEVATRERKHLQPRPPVVAMLGHVDHGKTSLLDAIRKTDVQSGEAGGITQHIGAYRIDQGDWHVTFVDTPGHKAFTEMRARGANLTDVVVLVVAADDGVMPQTAEAVAHAKAAGVAIVVALNKIDLPGVDLNRVFTQLSEHELAPAEWGGETDLIRTSAVTGEGVEELLSHLSTLSELLELKADPTVPTVATVIEAQLREGRGVVANVLVREGTLRTGQSVVCGPGAGRVRALRDHHGRPVKEATPGTPVEVSGLAELPRAGDNLYQVESPSRAKLIAAEIGAARRAAVLQATPKPRSLEALIKSEAEAEVPELKVIVKADVQGSVEVLRQSLAEFPSDKARLTILHAGVGAVSEADVHLAKASGALIIGFHMVAEDHARQLADQLGVEIRPYRVIYELLDDLHKALAGLLAPIENEEIRGVVDVRQVFHVSRVGMIAGCYVTEGIVNRNHRVRLVRDGRVVLEGKGIASLKRFKDDTREVRAGFECGLKIEGFDDVKPGDSIQAYEVVEVAQEL